MTSTLTPKTEPNLASLLTTPLDEGPAITSGPYDSAPPKEASSTSSSSSFSPHSSSQSSKKKNSTGGNSSLALSSSSPLPDIPWDDADLMMYFTDPDQKY
ncbi:hypothetical protein ElyMa_001153900 [Elysia marginata]|uniref:Uncharacterized protein n=1 Tax=Elysia marginata TaxID=1093978 RepID=A0AAV4I237_9GAST|nr:hypothetical protein ElyMa_001153900 [Elysia marginata]